MALQVPELNPGGEVQAQLREEREQRRGKAALGRETGSTVPTTVFVRPPCLQSGLSPAGFLTLSLFLLLQVGHIAPSATIDDLTSVFSK